jgi:hypothetical protein
MSAETDDPGKFWAAMRALAWAEAILHAASLKIVEERIQADPELRAAMIDHFQREALWYAARENPEPGGTA